MRFSRVVGPRRSEVVTAQDPVPADHQVLVEVLACGVCTSDIGPWRTHDPAAEPVRLGHEMVGRVAATGRHAGQWRPGDLVTGLGGDGFATMALMDANAVLPVPPGVEPALAIGEPVADLEEALSRTGIRPGDKVAVVGLGFMGLGLVQLARRHAPGLLIGVDPDPARRERALALGCDLAFAPDDVPVEFRSDSGRATEARPSIVLEATGVTPGLRTAGSMVRPFGTLCVVGYHHTGDAMMDMDLWYKAVTVVNGFCPDRTRLVAAMRDALGLIAERRFSYAPLITHRFGLDQVDEAFGAMEEAGPGFVKGVVLL
ncbi:zinc-dependent alcohol dehydrogenase [Actinacidiphila acididurans]|uniref:2-deoxy-scyllo-inosamine dehydrogenase n=1 Tax=Actinacidiphila acididurans TaxID=2784346 RepID=A0ABS2U3V8_9ACTN|nr:alcohol dehydrogenase catalytic domain-containing protein [Actinacidiphila acididurans]MBM9510279.1 alcohol dehydrogenase catalytic domain-containing protein [Actinacidiphila acididurans]